MEERRERVVGFTWGQWFAAGGVCIALMSLLIGMIQTHIDTAEATYARKDTTELQFKQLTKGQESMQADMKELLKRVK